MNNISCGDCNNKAKWMRVTQFAGKHPFCDEHGKLQKDFLKSDSSYFFWKSLTVEKDNAK